MTFETAAASTWGANGRAGDRVLIVARELTRGGAAYLALRHARTLLARHAVDVLVTGPCDDEFVAEFPAEVPVYRFNGPRFVKDDDWRRVVRQFAVDHAGTPPFRRSYQTILATSVFPDPVACAAVLALRAPRRLVFLVDEGLALCGRRAAWERALLEQCVLGADTLVPVSRRLLTRMAEHFPALRVRPWRCLPPPVEVETIRRLAAEPQTTIAPSAVPSVLTISRLSPDKRIPLCVQVHHRLKQQGVHFRWYVIGGGEDEDLVRSEIQARGLDDDFLLVGRQDNVYSILNACDLVALFSISEGCPTVVLEALTLDRPVIMTDVNGAEEMIEHETTGLIVAREPDAIAEGLARMVSDAGLRARFRANLAGRARDATPSETLLDLVAAPLPEPLAPRVTILIPTYNQAPFIDQAILSALGQDLPALEVVVLDDASTDETGAIAQTWQFDRRFRYVRNERNLGRVANYRRGLVEHARGAWVMMLDGDDHLTDPSFARLACEAIDRHGQADRPIVFAQAGHRVHALDGRRADVEILPPIDGPERLLDGAGYLRFVFATSFFTHLGAVYRRDAAIAAGAYPAEIQSSDMDFLLRLALDGEVLLLNRVAGCWVHHDTNTSAHLTIDDLAANVAIFRKAARRAVERGLATWPELDGPLTRYEATILVDLFEMVLRGRGGSGIRILGRFLRIALAINPRLFRDALFLSACRRYLRTLARPSLQRRPIGRLALQLFRASRAIYRGLGGKPLIQALGR